MPAPTDDLDRLGTMIRSARRARGMSQDDLAERLGIAQSYLSAIERGTSKGEIGATLIEQLHEELGLDIRAMVKAAALRSRTRRAEDGTETPRDVA